MQSSLHNPARSKSFSTMTMLWRTLVWLSSRCVPKRSVSKTQSTNTLILAAGLVRRGRAARS